MKIVLFFVMGISIVSMVCAQIHEKKDAWSSVERSELFAERSAKERIVDELISIIASGKEYDYIGEAITQYEHAVQCAHQAKLAGFDDEMIIAALLHDIGHLCAPAGSKNMDGYGVAHHEDIGADFLKERGFSHRVTEVIRAHAKAKRYLITKDPEYAKTVSSASMITFRHQGGVMTPEEVVVFEKSEFFQDKVNLRLCEERAKVKGAHVPELASYRALLVQLLGMTLQK